MIQADVDDSLNLVHSVYQQSLDFYKELFKEKVNLSISIFSDNIVIACKVKVKEQLESIFRIVELLTAIIQGNLLFKGILVREA